MPNPNKILICSALKFEARGIIDKLELKPARIVEGIKTYKGDLQNHQAYLCITGVGLQNGSAIVKKVLDAIEPDVVMNFGLAGSLIDALKPGQLFIPLACKNIEGQEYKCDNYLREKWREYAEPDRRIDSEYKLISLDNPVNRREVREKLRKDMQVHAVDMEAFEQAKLAFMAGLPFVCLKIISDNAGFLAAFQYWTGMRKKSELLGETVKGLLRLFVTL